MIHYLLRESSGKKLVFADDPPAGQFVHKMTYQAVGRYDVSYRFEYGDRLIDSGLMTHQAAIVRPLSE